MVAIQFQFEQFHQRIRLDEDDEHANLREKRDVLLKNLRERLGADVPTFIAFNQGSYSMNIGTLPLDGNYDIDVGLIFSCKKEAYPNPVDLKKKIRDALTHGNRTVVIRRPCVTVTYLRDSKPEYHVDLAIYAQREDSFLDLAMGKEFSADDKSTWDISNPKMLTETIKSRFTEEDAAQYRKCIKYLKRWRDKKIPNGSLISIAITVAAYNWFQPYKDYFSSNYIDIIALRNWINAILGQFQRVWITGEVADRLRIVLPVEPMSDLLEEMTNQQMNDFKNKLQTLSDDLKLAEEEKLPEEASKIMVREFGDEFPVPTKEETAKSVKAPYVSTGSSA